MPERIVYEKRVLCIDHVNLQYGDKVILRDVNAEIYDLVRENCTQGQVVGLLGPSGMGKTQLFRILAGLNKPTSGQVLVGNDVPVHTGLVGVVSQKYTLFEHRTVLGNIMLGAKQRSKTGKEAREKANRMLGEFGMADKAKSYPAQLSGGQQQRVAIAQQILCSEHYILMDEPAASLDLMMQEKVAEMIAQVASLDTLNTIIFSTHNIAQACAMADHLWLLGRESDGQGGFLPGANIRKVYDLTPDGADLCWHPEIRQSRKFLDFVAEVEGEFRKL